MRNKILFIIFIFNVYIISLCSAQTDANPQMITPEAATLGKFGAYPVSYYNGTPNISLPLYSLKFCNSEIPISINYDASGVLVNSEPGFVGQNWSLDAGGVVTRTVNGIPDEQPYSNSPYGVQKYGYWYGINNIVGGLKSADYIKNLSFLDPNNTVSIFGNLPYEHTPDLFTFNFCGNRGRFVIGNDGQVKLISDNPYKVDLSKFVGNSSVIPETSQITITDQNGIKYTFGGTFNSLEVAFETVGTQDYVTATNKALKRNTPGIKGVVDAWYLTKITYPNTNVIYFKYKDQKALQTILSTGSGDLLDFNYVKKIIAYNFSIEQTYLPDNSGSTNNSTGLNLSFIKTTYLDSIITSQGDKVAFVSSEKLNSFYGDNRPSTSGILWFTHNTRQLNNILIYNNQGENIKNISLSYSDQKATNIYGDDYFADNCYRNFLTLVNINDQSYSFDYHNKNLLPHPLNISIDFWGYFNNNKNPFLPTFDASSATLPSAFDIDVSNRKASSNYADYGLLSKITYPTGGFTSFDYESNDYGKILRRTKASGFYPSIDVEYGYAGGARIAEITDNPGVGQQSVTRHFYYKKDYTPTNTTGTSSGILTDFNVYCITFKDVNNHSYFHISGNNINAATSINEPPLGYSEVTEVLNDGSFKKYFYTNKISNPDIYTLGSQNSCYIQTINSDFTSQMERLYKYSSCELERGKVTEYDIYNSSGIPIFKESYTYNTDAGRYNDAIITYALPFWDPNVGMIQSYAIYYYPYLLTSKTTETYDVNGGNKVSVTENDTYSNKLISTKTIANSDGNTQNIKYKYPFEYDLSHFDSYYDKNTTALHNMVNYNIIGIPVEVTNYKSDKVVGSKLTLFNCNSSGFNTIDRILRWDSNVPSSGSFASTVNVSPPYQFQYDTNYKNYEVYDQYDNHGNLLQYHKTDGINVSIIWSYNYQYPIAEIKNATYTDIEAALGYNDTQIASLAASSTPDVSNIRTKLISYFSNKTSLISTYTFKPLVGIQTATAPNGVVTTYIYDNFNRLWYIKDNNGNKIANDQYNYSNH